MRERSLRRRAYLYITRKSAGQLQVAVFRHPDFEVMTLGVQVPGGTIEPHETPEEGALREVLEESGLADFSSVRLLARDLWHEYPDGLSRERFFYQLEVSGTTQDIWEHTVTDGELDKGMVFSYRWADVPGAKSILGPMGDFLHLLE